MSNPIERVGVIGAGQMGAGIAEVSARAGVDVLVFETTDALVTAGRNRITKSLERGVSAGKVTDREKSAALAKLSFTTDLADMADRQLVIEAVIEDVAVKSKVFAELDEVITDPDAVLASNTSSIPIMKIAAATKNPSRVLGLHFFNPVPVLPLVELQGERFELVFDKGLEAVVQHDLRQPGVARLFQCQQQVLAQPLRRQARDEGALGMRCRERGCELDGEAGPEILRPARLGRAARAQSGIKIRQPLSRIRIVLSIMIGEGVAQRPVEPGHGGLLLAQRAHLVEAACERLLHDAPVHQMFVEAHEHQPAMEESIDQEGPAILRKGLGFACERLTRCVWTGDDHHFRTEGAHPRHRAQTFVTLPTEF